jgi:hypothetical protein
MDTYRKRFSIKQTTWYIKKQNNYKIICKRGYNNRISKQYVQLVLRLEAKEGKKSFLIEVKLVVSANRASVIRFNSLYALSYNNYPFSGKLYP